MESGKGVIVSWKFPSSLSVIKEYRGSVGILRELKIIAEELRGGNVLGEAFSRIVSVNPRLSRLITDTGSPAEACYRLGHDPRFYSALRNFKPKCYNLPNGNS